MRLFKYYAINLFLAPGVVVHELGHVLFCWLGKARIHRIKLFQFGNPAGYVDHEMPDKIYHSVLVSFGPLLVNSLLAMVLFSRIHEPYGDYRTILAGWLGFALAMHAIPSCGDAQALWQAVKHRFWRNPLVVIAAPFSLFLYILNWLRRWHLHFAYTFFLAWLAIFYLRA